MSESEPIVLQLQALAMDEATAVPELLRRALVIAVKLGLDDVETWIKHELHGYQGVPQVPPYRKLQSRLQGWDREIGWVPVHTANPDKQKLLETVPVAQSVDQLVNLLAQDKDTFEMPYSAHQRAALKEHFGIRSPIELFRIVSRSQFAGILGEVRTRILSWTLELERQGILGEEFSFSTVERQKAAMAPSIHIGGNFQGVLGDVSGSTLNQQMSMTFRGGDVQGLKDYLREQGLDDGALTELERAVREDPPPSAPGTFGAKVSAWMGQMLQRAASGTWAVGIGAAGNLLASALARYYGLPGS